MIRVLFLLLTVFSLTACVTPMRLGISEAEWQNYSSDERQKIKDGYHDIQKNHSQIEEKVIPDGSTVHVKISGGKVSLPPFAGLSNYTPVEFDIASGDSQTVKITELGGDKHVSMKVSYLNKTLYLDPSRFDISKKVGSIQLHCSPIWDREFTYQNVSSSGYVHLTNVNVTVRKYENNEPSDNPN